MKIALLTTWFPPLIVGSGNRFYEIGKRLAGKHEVHVYTTGIEGCVNEGEMDGMYIHRYGMFSMSKSIERDYHALKLKFSFDVFKKLNKNFDIFDIIDCNIVSKPLTYVSYFASKSLRVPLILTWHEVWHGQNFKILNPVMALPGFFLELFMPKLADMNIAVSETTKRRLVNLLGVNPDKIVVIPNGVDLNKFDAISMDKKYGRILYVGRLESHKRVDTLMLAYHRLKKRFTNIELIIVGKGPQKEYLQNVSKELNLKDVTFYNSISYDKLIELMKSSWIFVLPSVREGQGIVLLEAMAAGTPLIAIQAEGSAVGDIVKNDYNGLLVPGGEIGRAIQKLLTNEDLYTQIRKNGLQFVKGYDWAKTAERTAEVYEKIRRSQ